MTARIVLAIDTSTSFAQVGLMQQSGEAIIEVSSDIHSHNSALCGMVEAVLSRAGIGFGDLNLIVIGDGPGSFTGLRIGFAYAKGLSISLRIPLVVRSSFAAAAAAAGTGDVIVFEDARRAEIFLGIYRNSEVGCSVVSPPSIVATSTLFDRIKGIKGAEFPHFVSCSHKLIPDDLHVPILAPQSAMGLLLLSASESQVATCDPSSPIYLADLKPNYIREVAAKTIRERELLK